jgi:hypothetical protein
MPLPLWSVLSVRTLIVAVAVGNEVVALLLPFNVAGGQVRQQATHLHRRVERRGREDLPPDLRGGEAGHRDSGLDGHHCRGRCGVSQHRSDGCCQPGVGLVGRARRGETIGGEDFDDASDVHRGGVGQNSFTVWRTCAVWRKRSMMSNAPN